MKKFFTKSLLLILLAFGGIHAAYADYKSADSYNGFFQISRKVMTLDSPWVSWDFPNCDEDGDDDVLKFSRFYVGGSAASLTKYNTNPSSYFSNPWEQGAEILYLNRSMNITQRQNEAYGVGDIRNSYYSGKIRIAEACFYPGEKMGPAQMCGFFIRWTGWWDTNDNGGEGYWMDMGSAKNGTSSYGADWSREEGKGIVRYYNMTYDIPQTKAATFTRKPGGKIEASVTGNIHGNWNEFYDFGSDGTTVDGYGYYSKNEYGTVQLDNSTGAALLTLKGNFDETENFTIYYHEYYKRSATISWQSVGSAESEQKKTVKQHFQAKRINTVVKGFMYPSELQITANKWKNTNTLKWTINNNDANHNTDGGWLVFRQKEGESGYELLTSSRLNNSNNTYTDTHVETGAKYTYWVTFAPTVYGTISAPLTGTKLTVESNISHDASFKFSNLKTELSDAGGIEISWTPENTGSDFLFYVQRWDERTEQWINLKDVGQTGTTYVDKDVESMKFYKYRIKISYWGLDFHSADMSISYTVMSKVKGFTASQGTYSNMVKLNWNVTILSEGDTRYVVQRKLMGDQQANFTQIYETMGKESSFYYEDLSAQPGQFYIYKVTASVYAPEASDKSEDWAIGNSMETDGFVQSRGILSGRIKYGTGTAVPNVKVVLTKSGDNDNTAKQFYSLYLAGDNASGVQWELSDEMIANYFTGNNRPWSVQMYVHPDAGMTGTQDIFDVNGYAGVAVSPKDGEYNLMVKSATGSNAATYSATGIVIPANEYTHLVFSYDGGSTYTLRAIRPADENENGVVFEEGNTLKTFTGKANVRFDDTNRSRTITFGKSGFMGNIDEMRVWTKVLTDKEVETYHNRTLSCTEKNLLAYWPVDEGINGMLSVYDYSKTNGVANGNHAYVKGNVIVSEVVPTEEQLSIYSFTDENGNYVIRGVPFSGDGTTYLVRPVLGVHEFNPSYHTRYVSSNTLTHDNIEFEDVSSFKVTGVVYYENTTYPVQGCYLAVDGTTCTKDGQMIETDENGRFEISVPIGDHHITINKTGHTFVNEGRYPIGMDTKFTFDREVSNLTFYDNTLVNVAGRVVGGNIEGDKTVGFGESRNNIGVTELVLTPVNDLYSLNAVTITEGLTSRYENNTATLACASASDLVNSTSWRGAGEKAGKIYIQTDAKTGEFSAMVPPLTYNVEAPKVVNNEYKTVGEAGLVDVSNPLMVTEDSLTNVDGDILTFESHAIYKQIYHSEPNFSVEQVNFGNGAFGIASYETTDEIGNFKVEIINEEGEYTYGTPFFIEGDPYTFKLKGYEEYTNYDDKAGPVTVTVPLENCVVTISNALSNDQAVIIDVPEGEEELSVGEVLELEPNQLSLDEKGEATYTWKAGSANITAPYSRNLSMTYEVGGQVNSWKFNGEDFMPGVILGALPTGSNFVTQGPDKLLMILRDPPGSGSNAEWTSGTVTAYEKTIGHCWNTETTVQVTNGFGGDVTINTGASTLGAVSTVEIKTSTKDDLSWGGKAVSEGENSTTTSHSLTVTQTVATSDDPSLVGSLGDVFIGQSTNMIFGKARRVGFSRNQENQEKPELGVSEVMSVGSDFSTYFTYTAYYIESYLIPNWEALRNNLLVSVSEKDYNSFVNNTDELVYLTKLSPKDPKFGSDNHDKEVWGDKASKFGATEGPSYKIVYPQNKEKVELKIGETKEVDQDMVYHYNLQISNWVRHLAANEEEKVKAWEDRENKLLRNYSFDGGTSINYSYETDTTYVEAHEHNSGAIALLGNVVGFDFNGCGWEIETSTETGGTRHKNTSDTESKVASFSFNLVESGDDALTVDVFNSPYSYIFRTRAGQTSAPYEDEEYTKYYEPGKHKLHEKTMQIEVPDIEVEVPVVSNITSGSTASYTLKLMNKSEIDCDLYYKLLQMDETNPNGAQLSIDGVALSDNRVIKVPAGEVVTKTLLLKQSNLGVLDYENIGIVLASQEQGDPTGTYPQIADTVYISAYYVPSSSPVKMELSRTLLNTSSGTNLDITFNSFDRNYHNLKAFRIQYMKQGDTDWTMLKEYLLDTEGKQLSSLQAPLPETANVTYSLDMSSFADGKYTFRVLSASTYGTGEATLVTDAIEVVKDMSRPMAFGTPKPTTGFLGMGDDIEITFNEDINNGRLTSTGNFIVTAALNGQQVAHDVALMATGSEGAVAKTEANINLIGKSFAVDMWVRISGEGTIFSHGNGQTKLTLGVKEVEGNYYFSVNGVVCDTEHALPADKWIYLAFSLDQEGETSNFSALYANDAETIYLADELPIEKYEGNGVVALGNGFTGAIHEVTLWDAAVDVTNLQAQMYETKMPTTEKLIGYWKFNEGLGTQAKDVARNRHMNLAATSWYLNNQNKALALASDTLYDSTHGVVIYLAECAARNGDDFAVEMWFCAESEQDKALAYLFQTDAFSVVLENSKLSLRADDKVLMSLGNKAYNDDKWHHLAINVLRNGNTIVYIDGEAVGQIASAGVPALQTSYMYLGGKRVEVEEVNDEGQIERHYEMHDKLKVKFDEIRVWNATLNAKVLRDRMYSRLQGNEPGLVAYYPFEEEKLDANMQVVTEGSAMDMVTKRHKATGIRNNTYEVICTDEAPALKPVSKESNVNYNFVASERGIVIELGEDADRLEGTTVNITVKDVLDLNGNMSLPITWTALVQRNQLLWFENEVDVVGRIGEEKKFTATVTNQSAQTEYWVLNDLPSWLSANFTSGSLPALGTQEITFTVDASAPTGKSEFTVYMSGNNAILVPLTVNMNLRADAPEWSVDPADFESSATLFGAVMIDVDGKIAFSEDEDDLVAAFIDGKCVGVTHVQYDDYSDSYRAYLTIYGNSDDEDKEIKLMVWDASADIIHPVVYVYDGLEIKAGDETQLTFSVDGYWGDYDNIYCVYASNDIQQSTSLKKNWNWVSVYVQDATGNKVNSVLESINPNGAVVKNANVFSQYIKTIGQWNDADLSCLEGNTMYKLQMTAADTLVIEGETYDNNGGVSLVSGWNWIPYYRSFALSLDDAFASVEPARNDQVKGQEGYAMYNGTTWNGALKSLQPGKGYLYKSVSENEKTLNYPSQRTVATASLAPTRRMVKESMFAPVDPTEYESNMTILAVVMEGDAILERAQEIAVFDGATCMASAFMENDGYFYLTVPGDKTVADRLTVYAVVDGVMVETATSLYFGEDAIFGDYDAPFIVRVGESTAISKLLADGNYVGMQVVDLSGRVLYSGATADFDENDLHDGQYIFEFFTEDGQIVCYKQMIKRLVE